VPDYRFAVVGEFQLPSVSCVSMYAVYPDVQKVFLCL
jgi:hypothetical protein